MRKLLFIILFALIASNTNAQQICRAHFNMQYNSVLGTLNLIDSSYNTDSTTINIVHRNWEIRFYNDTNIITPISILTDSVQNPVIQTPTNFIGKAVVIYGILTANSCSDYNYDSLYINITPSIACQAAFTYSYDTLTHILHLIDNSYNTDSSAISVISWGWNANPFGISGWTTPNAYIQLNGITTIIPVCLTINTLNFCQSTYCGTINLNIPPPDTCITNFSYQIDTALNTVSFYDNSYTNNGNINSWYWTVFGGGVQLFSSSLQNPVYNYLTHGVFYVCLSTTTDSGCVSNYCSSLYIYDSINNNNCQLTVSAFVNHVSVINGNDGFIDLTVTGGLPPYNYQWNNGDSTQDISNLSVGVYTVDISTYPACPTYTYSYTILQPYDSINIVTDTLYSGIIDTCINFNVDSFYVANINVQGNTVMVEWVLIGGQDTVILDIAYNYSNFGAQIVFLTVNCDSAKDLATYISYIYISQIYNVPENIKDDNIKLYPNPVSDILNITFGEPCKKPIVIKIFSDIGQQLLFEIFAPFTDQLQFNVSYLPSGFYFVQIDSGNGKPVIKKLLK
jgi:hypothetical protein